MSAAIEVINAHIKRLQELIDDHREDSQFDFTARKWRTEREFAKTLKDEIAKVEGPMEGLTEGRMVHYVLPEDVAGAGNHRPAVVVNAWKCQEPCEGYVNLQVLVDGTNDMGVGNRYLAEAQSGLWWRTSICYSAEPKPNTWHWIEKA